MHRPIFGNSFAVLVAPILISVLVFNFLNKKKASARRNTKDVDAGASANSGGSNSSPVETNDSASCSSPTETDNGASSSSTASIGNCYEVFLSFRGLDTRDGFTSHLYKGLFNAGIHSFRDDDELRDGESIGQDLEAAITSSKILIPILSVNYGTSSWCLNELVQIMECKENNGQMVLPIFYKVKPADVRHQIGSFGDAFHERERRLRERPSFDPMILKRWKKALAGVGDLRGEEANGDEAELVELIVRKVLSELKKKIELVISKNLVGIDNPVKEIKKVVENKSHCTLFVGIYGMGGIGKTTLAKAIYNEISIRFEHRSFIADIRESWERNGAPYLQNKLIHDILKRENEVCDQDEGTTFISSRFNAKKVLILLDDVDNVAQLNCLAGNHDWFSLGSIIIITTRDKRILEAANVDHCYEHKEMDYDQSLILFSKHAFRRDFPPNEFKGLTCEVVPIARGLPLSLEVFGSLLCGKDPTKWREMIKKLKKVPCMEVQEKLRISYEALDYQQKQIFVDIACFLIGTDKRIAYYMWDACDFFLREGIEVLRFMSLIKVGDDHKVRMHDQLRDLGRTIVYEENQQQPQHRSRLWDPKEALEVLKRNKGTDKIEAINLSKGSSEGFGKTTEREDNIFTEKQFKNLMCLRFLNLEGVDLRGDFENSMEELKWLRWPNCPMNFEVKNLHVKELAVLEMSESAINGEWKGWSSFKMAEKLKFLDLSYSQSLENTDFLSAFKNLEVLILHCCERLQQIDSSIEDMEALRRLELCGCTCLKELPAEIGKLKALEQLLLSETYALSALPDNIGSLENLEILNISGSDIEELPDGIWRLTKLRELLAIDCRKLRGGMPESMSNLSSLQRLGIYGCIQLQSLPNLPSSLTDLGVTCRSHELPSLYHLTHLKKLQVYHCRLLKCIQALPSELPESLNTPFELETLEVSYCDSIETLDVSQFKNLRTLVALNCLLLEVRGLDKLIYLESLIVEWCDFKWLDLPKSECLKIFDVRNCKFLVEIQGLDRLEFLESLAISECTSIERLLLPKFGRLKELDTRDCKNLIEIQGLDRLECLELLDIKGCTSIERLDLPKSGSMKKLYAGGCENLAKIEGLDTLELLEKLHINECTSIERLYLPKFGRLKELKAEGCKNLAEIQGLDRLEFLESLIISGCTSIERLILPKSGSLKTLYADSCKKLAKIQGLDRLEFLEELIIKGCTSIRRLNLPKFRGLKELDAEDCDNLVEIQGLDRIQYVEILDIDGCTSIERLDLPISGSIRRLCAGDYVLR